MSDIESSQPETELSGDEAAMAQLAAKREQPAQADEEEEDAPAEQEEEEAEEEEEAPEEDDDPEIDLGDIKLKRSELKAGYMKDADYRQKTAAAAESKRHAEAEATQARTEREYYANHLDVVLERMQAQIVGSQQELAHLAQTDPAAWVASNQQFQERVADYQTALASRQAIGQRQQQEAESQQADYVREQQSILQEKLPEWRDPKVRSKESQGIAEFLLSHGYTNDELSSLQDHRALMIVRDAWKAMESVKARESAKGKQVAKEPARVLKPGPATPSKPSIAAYNDALRRARKSGSEEDAMAVLAARRSK